MRREKLNINIVNIILENFINKIFDIRIAAKLENVKELETIIKRDMIYISTLNFSNGNITAKATGEQILTLIDNPIVLYIRELRIFSIAKG